VNCFYELLANCKNSAHSYIIWVNFSFGPANCDAYSLIWALSSELNAGKGTEAKRGEAHTPRCARTNGKRPHGAFCSS
jgi:hypothetical protein